MDDRTNSYFYTAEMAWQRVISVRKDEANCVKRIEERAALWNTLESYLGTLTYLYMFKFSNT
jgi:hypothetical protein